MNIFQTAMLQSITFSTNIHRNEASASDQIICHSLFISRNVDIYHILALQLTHCFPADLGVIYKCNFKICFIDLFSQY